MCSVQDEENVPTDLSQSKGRVHHSPHEPHKHGKGRKRLLPKCQENCKQETEFVTLWD